MSEHRLFRETVRMVDDDYTAWLDDGELGDDDFAAGIAAMHAVERDWWASAFDV